jgi:hypothetical protein
VETFGEAGCCFYINAIKRRAIDGYTGVILCALTWSLHRAAWLQKRKQTELLPAYPVLCLPQFPPEFFYLTAEPEPLHHIKQIPRYDTNKKWSNDNSPQGERIGHVAIIGQGDCLVVEHGKRDKSEKNRNNAAGVKKNFHNASVLTQKLFVQIKLFDPAVLT